MDDREVYRKRIEQLVEEEKARTCGPESAARYVAEHRLRFRKVLDICRQFVPDPSASVLDVGRSSLTEELASHYSTLWSLGFDLAIDEGGHRENNPLAGIKHIVFDLNESHDCTRWPVSPLKFDLIVFCEAMEHLPTAPEFSMLMLSSLLKESGFLVVTTPNAVSLSKRLNLLLGRNPFEKIRYYSQNAGHFREYTMRELQQMGEACGLRCVASRHTNYSLAGGRTAIKLATSLFPPFRDGLILAYQKESSSTVHR